MTAMTPSQIDQFLRTPRIAKLATLNGDGSPTVVPVWFEWDGAAARLFSTASARKVRAVKADPRVALTVEDGVGMPEAWVTIEGRARVEPGDAALIERLARAYYTPGEAERALAEWHPGSAAWVTIVIDPAQIRSLAPPPGSRAEPA